MAAPPRPTHDTVGRGGPITARTVRRGMPRRVAAEHTPHPQDGGDEWAGWSSRYNPSAFTSRSPRSVTDGTTTKSRVPRSGVGL